MTAPEYVQAIPFDDGTRLLPDLTFTQPVPAEGEPVPAAAVPLVSAADVAEERDRATELSRQLIAAVRDYDRNRPRSLQTRIGPSEIGSDCLRQLGYKVAGHPRTNHGGGDPWPAFVGTATHAALDEVFSTRDGWETERRVVVDPDLGLSGSTDLLRLFDGVTVIDHKVVGADTLRKAKANGPSRKYRTQINAYAHGWIAAGVPVEWVAIAYWPRSGRLSGLHVWLERYDPAPVDWALNRLDVLGKLHGLLGPELFRLLPVAEDYCDSCPFFNPGSIDPATACAGADAVGRGIAA